MCYKYFDIGAIQIFPRTQPCMFLVAIMIHMLKRVSIAHHFHDLLPGLFVPFFCEDCVHPVIEQIVEEIFWIV